MVAGTRQVVPAYNILLCSMHVWEYFPLPWSHASMLVEAVRGGDELTRC